MDWEERRNELQDILGDITESEMPVQVKRNLRRLLTMVVAINEDLGTSDHEARQIEQTLEDLRDLLISLQRLIRDE